MFSLERTLLAEANLVISINAVNDPPTVTTPAFGIVVDEDASYVGLPGIFVTDPDVHEEPGGVLEVSSFCQKLMENLLKLGEILVLISVGAGAKVGSVRSAFVLSHDCSERQSPVQLETPIRTGVGLTIISSPLPRSTDVTNRS